MECNKDEAARSRGIAEAKFLQHDYSGARKFALKARQLFPELDGLPQFISVLDVHIVAQEKLHGGETNWYGILQVDPLADEGTIRKQYRKLALLLHPDKNKSVGAEAAFKHISEAWGVLSDKTKKAAYDMRRNAKASQSSKVAPYREPSPTPNGYHNVTRPSTTPNHPHPHRQPQPQPQPQGYPGPNPSAHPPPPPPPPQPDVRTFWTACPSCKLQFEYQRTYVNKNLCCPICYKPFLAREVAAVGGTTLWPPHEQQGVRMDAAGHHHANGTANGTNLNSFGNGNFPWYKNPPAAQGVHAQTNERTMKENMRSKDQKQKQKGQKKKEKEENKAKAAAQAKEAFDRLIARSKVVIEQKLSSDKAAALGRKVTADNTSAHVQPAVSEKRAASDEKANLPKTSPPKVPSSSNEIGEGKENCVAQGDKDTDKIGISKLVTRKSPRGKRGTSSPDDIVPAKKPRTDLEVTLEQVSNGVMNKESEEIKKSYTGKIQCPNVAKETETVEPTKDLGVDATDNACKGPSLQANSPLPDKNLQTDKNTCEMKFSSVPADAMNVPDADFYDFDKDRSEDHFSAGQIWAAYDDDDGMPRYYARISKVISHRPFKVQMSWLEARFPSDETTAWLDSGFSYTCGEYRLGKPTSSEHINTFSHLMTFEKGQRGGFRIYPRKGDIWALYKDWNTLTEKEAKHGYEMVEILTDFKDEVGAQVSILTKVEGFKTLFRRQLGLQYVDWVSPKELRKFSHQVPAHSLTVEQAPGIQEGCWELDPASIPMDLITGKRVE